MKKVVLLVLAVLLVFGLCSCEPFPHRKLQFDDGESHCFSGVVNLDDDYIAIGNGSSTEYFSIGERQFTIIKCDCDNIKK